MRGTRAPQIVLQAGWHGALAAEQHASRQRCLGLRQRTLDVVERPTPQAQQRIGDIVAGVAFEECPALGEGRDGVDAPRAQERRVVEVVEARRALDLRRYRDAVALAQRLARRGQGQPQPAAPLGVVDRLDAEIEARERAGQPRIGANDADDLVRAVEGGKERLRASIRLADARVARCRRGDQRHEQQHRGCIERSVAAGHGHHRRHEHRDEERCPPRPAEQRPAHGARDEARRHERQRGEQGA